MDKQSKTVLKGDVFMLSKFGFLCFLIILCNIFQVTVENGLNFSLDLVNKNVINVTVGLQQTALYIQTEEG